VSGPEPTPPQAGRETREKHPIARMLLIGLLVSIVGDAVVLLIDWFPVAASKSAHQIDTLYDVLLLVSVPIFVLVMTVAIYSVVKFRARPGDMGDGPPIHGNTRLEVIWVTIPFIIVSTLAIYAWIVLNDVEAKKPNEMHVQVFAQQFAWHFEYPGEGNVKSDQLYLPKGRPVKFDINSQDVIHSFWVPSFRLKSDAVPGITTHWRTTPDRLGRYDVVCAELCGLGHATMRTFAYVVTPAQFSAWVAKQRNKPPPGGFPTKPLPKSKGSS
jgi:cytochrome c oxidase subunit 2